MIEEWREVVGAEDKYEVSSLGRVRTKPRILKAWLTNGYPTVSIGKGKKEYVHRLVCEAFNGASTGESKLVAHADGSKDNNTPENLRWATYSENLADSIAHGTCRLPQYANPRKGEKHGMAVLSAAKVASIKNECRDGIARMDIARKYGISRNHLWRILRGKSWGTQ